MRGLALLLAIGNASLKFCLVVAEVHLTDELIIFVGSSAHYGQIVHVEAHTLVELVGVSGVETDLGNKVLERER